LCFSGTKRSFFAQVVFRVQDRVFVEGGGGYHLREAAAPHEIRWAKKRYLLKHYIIPKQDRISKQVDQPDREF
jgi:hypothetical protein